VDILRRPAPCPHCGFSLDPAQLRCPYCGHATLTPGQLDRLRRESRELSARWSNSPYLRDAARNAYTLRGRARGFLQETSHPLARDLLSWLRRQAAICPPRQWPFLICRAIDGTLAEESPALSRLMEEMLRLHQDALPRKDDPGMD